MEGRREGNRMLKEESEKGEVADKLRGSFSLPCS